MRSPSRTAKRSGVSVGSSVQSQRLALTQMGRTSTPCSRASRTICAGRVEAHRLGVEQRRAEHVRMPALQPAAGIGDQREGGGVALGKAVAAEALQLREGALGEGGLVAARHHAADQLVAERADPAGELEGGHGAAQLVGLAGGEAGAFDGDPHRLLLEQRHAEGLAEHLLQFGLRILDRLLALAPPQIGMHHVALDRARPHDRDLDDQIVEGARLDARQHRHLRPALDLEGAERVGLADHRVGARILGRDGGEIEGRCPCGRAADRNRASCSSACRARGNRPS